jgi:hypothetical protein
VVVVQDAHVVKIQGDLYLSFLFSDLWLRLWSLGGFCNSRVRAEQRRRSLLTMLVGGKIYHV